jgi:hypothetical protein
MQQMSTITVHESNGGSVLTIEKVISESINNDNGCIIFRTEDNTKYAFNFANTLYMTYKMY